LQVGFSSVGVMAEALGDIGELLDGRSRVTVFAYLSAITA